MLAIELVAERTGGRGAIAVECSVEEDGPRVRARGIGDPAGDVPGPLAHAFRQALAAATATASPDDLGMGGTGLVLRFPD
jgi:hypothetical protein